VLRTAKRAGSKYRPNMKNKNLIRFLNSLVLLPVVATSFSLGGPQSIENSRSVLAKINIEAEGTFALNLAEDPEALTKAARADAVDAYFRDYAMPLAGTGWTMVSEAEKNSLDWRLLPAIAVRESTGGKNACKRVPNNPFGWGSCKIGFESNEHAIAILAKNLGGNNPNTDHHYAGKTTEEILKTYNPPSVVHNYAKQVMNIMKDIGEEDITSASLISANT